MGRGYRLAEDTPGRGGPIAEHYGEFYSRKNPEKVYPVEFVVRTLLGTYPGLAIDRTTYRGSRVLDLGFGDGRNMPLLRDLGFEVYGVEISPDRKSTRLNSSHMSISYAVFCLKKKKYKYSKARFNTKQREYQDTV